MKSNYIVFSLLILTLIISACNSGGSLSETSNIETDNERARLARVEMQNQALAAYKQYLETRYPDWQLQGDDLDPSGLQLFSKSTFTAHLSSGENLKIITLTLRTLNRANGSVYWIAYEPSTLERLEDIGSGKKPAGKQ